jgi:hypothetical protein
VFTIGAAPANSEAQAAMLLQALWRCPEHHAFIAAYRSRIVRAGRVLYLLKDILDAEEIGERILCATHHHEQHDADHPSEPVFACAVGSPHTDPDPQGKAAHDQAVVQAQGDKVLAKGSSWSSFPKRR